MYLAIPVTLRDGSTLEHVCELQLILHQFIHVKKFMHLL